MILTGSRPGQPSVREALSTDLGRHAPYPPSQPRACLCGLWDGTGTYAGHLLASATAVAQIAAQRREQAR